MKMTMRQAMAWSRPCYDAEATTQQRFTSRGRAGRWAVSAILTANVGLE
jgi:hypothetical protein